MKQHENSNATRDDKLRATCVKVLNLPILLQEFLIAVFEHILM